MKNKYRVGQKVKIKKELVNNTFYGNVVFVRDMEKYRGKVATITRFTRYTILLDIDKGGWNWSREMLEPIANSKKHMKNKMIDIKKLGELAKEINKREPDYFPDYKGIEVGSMLENEGFTCKVLAKVGKIIFTSRTNMFDQSYYSPYTNTELSNAGYKLLSSTPTVEVEGKKYRTEDIVKNCEEVKI